MILHADSEDSDQTGRMTRLTWVFAGRTDHFADFVLRRLICNLGESNELARFCVLLASLKSFFFFFFFVVVVVVDTTLVYRCFKLVMLYLIFGPRM